MRLARAGCISYYITEAENRELPALQAHCMGNLVFVAGWGRIPGLTAGTIMPEGVFMNRSMKGLLPARARWRSRR